MQVLLRPVPATEYELLDYPHLLEGVRRKTVRGGVFQNLRDGARGLVFEPVAPAVPEPGEVAVGSEHRDVHVFALAVAGRNFFACEQERVAFSLREGCNLVAQGLEPRRRGPRLLGVVLVGERKVVGVVGATGEIEPDRGGRLLQYGRRGPEFHVVARIVGVAVHFACRIPRRLRGLFCKHVQLERLRL